MVIILAATSLSIPPAAEAAGPKALKTFSGALDPGEITDPPLDWQLDRDVSEFLFHYAITGGSEPEDVVYLSIAGITSFDFLIGEGWRYCPCPLGMGSYGVVVEAEPAATGRITYEVGFYDVPQPPVDFSGFIPANSYYDSNDFGVLFPSSTSHQVTLGVTGPGDYELFVDGDSKGVVTKTTDLSIFFSSGFHVFDVIAGQEDVRWSVQIGQVGQPKLEVTIVDPCPTLNPESGQSVCVTGAEATASDGQNPSVSYAWTASGGSFNSTTSQWVEWTAPPGVAAFTLTVEASAPGYSSDTDSLNVQVVPEFSSLAAPFLLAIVLAVLLARKRSRQEPVWILRLSFT